MKASDETKTKLGPLKNSKTLLRKTFKDFSTSQMQCFYETLSFWGGWDSYAMGSSPLAVRLSSPFVSQYVLAVGRFFPKVVENDINIMYNGATVRTEESRRNGGFSQGDQ